MKKELTAAERYRQRANPVFEIVEVTVPSGEIFTFKKPSTFTMLFEYGHVPQSAANNAVQSWIDAGILKVGDVTEDTEKLIAEAMNIFDRVLELSVDPKLVIGDAIEPNELSVREIDEADLKYLVSFVAAGGVEAASLGNFPAGAAEPGPASGSGGKGFRVPPKRTGSNKRSKSRS